MKWRIEKTTDGGYKFWDEKGEPRGQYNDADIMAAHFCFALQDLERLGISREYDLSKMERISVN